MKKLPFATLTIGLWLWKTQRKQAEQQPFAFGLHAPEQLEQHNIKLQKKYREIASKHTFQYRFVVVLVLFVGIAVAYMDRVNVSVLAANQAFLTDMGIKGDPVSIGMIMSVFLVFYGLANFLVSKFNRIMGARKAMMLSIAMWMLSLLVGGLAPSFAVMLLARVILGMGEGFYYPLQSVIVKQWIPPKERGKANAAWSIGQSLAPALAMPALSYIIALWGWRESFHALLPITALPLFMLAYLVTDTPEENKRVGAEEAALIQ
ncbi:MAG: MFS transporter, partial [Deltaproteobacteria bacterium]|nr:MFS transporter [Deltaproteobacteria bacterium]